MAALGFSPRMDDDDSPGAIATRQLVERLQERIAELETALKVAYRFFGKDEADHVKRNEVRGIVARALGKQ